MINNSFVRNYFEENKLELIDHSERPWGGWYLFERGIDFDKKILWAKPGTYLSLQYHGDKDHPPHSEYWTALTPMRILLGTKNAIELNKVEFEEEIRNLKIIDLKPSEEITLPGGFIHALVNPFDHDIYWIETRKSQLEESSDDREVNITRIYDQAGRNGTPTWPQWLVDRIVIGK